MTFVIRRFNTQLTLFPSRLFFLRLYTMRLKSFTIFISILIVILGVVQILDWVFFWNNNEPLALGNRELFLNNYYERFPSFLNAFLTKLSVGSELIIIILLSLAGIILIKQKKVACNIIGGLAFLMGVLHLWSLM